jgi:hypothetical protein
VKSDTTAVCLSWTFYLLTQHPDVEQKVVDEIRSVVGDSIYESRQLFSHFLFFDFLKVQKESHLKKWTNWNISITISEFVHQRIVFFDDSKTWGKLLMNHWDCIHLSPMMRAQQCMMMSCQVDMISLNKWFFILDIWLKWIIPAHTTVVYSAYAGHRLAENFKDPLKFNPDRWATDSIKVSSWIRIQNSLPKFLLLVLQLRCIPWRTKSLLGTKHGVSLICGFFLSFFDCDRYQEIKVAMCAILQKFSFKLVDPKKSVELKLSVTMPINGELKVIPVPRTHWVHNAFLKLICITIYVYVCRN